MHLRFSFRAGFLQKTNIDNIGYQN